MNVEPRLMVVSGARMLLYAAAFLSGDRVHPLQVFVRDRRTAISIGAGTSIAYVFVHLLPELQEARRGLA